ncbi:MAG TPA: hypothetical protein VE715_12160, partial [Blastocatellia bacterium]|nr:hypothetical protein [Blastocatellia bacterium]
MVVLALHDASLDFALDLQTMRRRLVVLDINIPIGGACFHVRFDFHDCQFPFLKNLMLVTQPQLRALPAP